MGPFKRLWGFAHTLVSYLLMSWRGCLSIRRWEGPSLTRCPWLIALHKDEETRRANVLVCLFDLPPPRAAFPRTIAQSYGTAITSSNPNLFEPEQARTGTLACHNIRQLILAKLSDAKIRTWQIILTFYLIWTNSISLAVWSLKNLSQWNFKCSSQKKKSSGSAITLVVALWFQASGHWLKLSCCWAARENSLYQCVSVECLNWFCNLQLG